MLPCISSLYRALLNFQAPGLSPATSYCRQLGIKELSLKLLLCFSFPFYKGKRIPVQHKCHDFEVESGNTVTSPVVVQMKYSLALLELPAYLDQAIKIMFLALKMSLTRLPKSGRKCACFGGAPR